MTLLTYQRQRTRRKKNILMEFDRYGRYEICRLIVTVQLKLHRRRRC